MREIMDCISDPEIHTVVIMSSAQVGKTELLLNIIGYFVHQDPSPILLLQPTLEMAKAFSNDRLSPMIRDTKVLSQKINTKSRSNGNTMLHKSFPGGHITLAGANSPASLASRPIRVLLCDEVDRYELSAGGEGDPVNLAEKRTTTFYNKKKIYVSTPGNDGTSRIEPLFEKGDMRRYQMPCPHCGVYQVFNWQNMVFQKGDLAKTTYYRCDECDGKILSSHKREMITHGKWVAEKETMGVASFHLWEVASPWVPFHETVKAFLDAVGKPDELKVWVNTATGETWKDKGEKPDWRRIYERRESWDRDIIPRRALRLTAAVDVQRDRLECEIKGHGRNGESWTIDYHVWMGSLTDLSSSDKECPWRKAEAILEKEWKHELGGKIRIHRMAIDSSDQTMLVYEWASRMGSRVCCVKGMQTLGTAIGVPKKQEIRIDGKPTKRGVLLWRVGTDTSKETIYGRLQLDHPTEEEQRKDGFPFGYMHFPDYIDQEFFEQLCAEQKVRKKNKKGYLESHWEKTRDRNESLDTNVYNYAMYYRNRYNSYTEEKWRELEAELGMSVSEQKATTVDTPENKEPIAKRSGGNKIIMKKSKNPLRES